MNIDYNKLVEAEMALRGIAQLSNDDVSKLIKDLSRATQWNLGRIHGISQASDWQLRCHFKSDHYRERVRKWEKAREELSAITDAAVLIELAQSLISEEEAVHDLFRVQVTRSYDLGRRLRLVDRRDPDCDCWFSISDFINELRRACAYPSIASERGVRGRFQRKYQRIRDKIEELRYMIEALRKEEACLKEDNDRKEQRQVERDRRERSWDGYVEPRKTLAESRALDRSLAYAEGVREQHASGQNPDRFGYDD